ncbi:RNA-binding protein 34 isoform 2-T2 [Menidia menidia]
MKKKVRSGEPSPGQPSPDYVVGQVSGSLFKESKAAAAGSLSALFSSASPAGSVLFQPAPKPVPTSTQTEEGKKESSTVKGESNQKKGKKPHKQKSVADQKLENREISLQTADDEEQGQGASGNKRKRKASESAADLGAEHWVLKRQKQKANRKEDALKSNRTVFVGNLPISCTKKMLRSLFKEKGSIESIRFRSVVREDPSMSRKLAVIKRKIHPQRQNLNAYVVFKDEDGATKALERNGTEIEKDFHIRVDRVSDSSLHDHKRSVFVGNLAFEMSELAFRKHFEECGAVEAVRLVRDQTSGLGKGFGYVLFKKADSVQLALELDGSKLEGRSVRVKRSVKKEKQKNKSDGREPRRKPGRAPPPGKGAGHKSGPGRGGFKPSKRFPGNPNRPAKSSTAFTGEMVDPTKKIKKKGLKKKGKANKTVHI